MVCQNAVKFKLTYIYAPFCGVTTLHLRWYQWHWLNYYWIKNSSVCISKPRDSCIMKIQHVQFYLPVALGGGGGEERVSTGRFDL